MTDSDFTRYMSAIAKGDRESLRFIYDEYLRLVFAVVYDTIGQREETEDVTSEFFIKMYSVAASYRPGNGHKRWMVTIAKNMAVDRVRKLGREALVDEIPESPNSRESHEDEIVNRMTMQQALKTLKPEEREVLDLKTVGGFTFREISEMTRRPMGTVTWLYGEAIKKLRRCRL